MGERTNEIKSQIGQHRHDLGSNLQELEHKVKRATDWRAQFEDRPMVLIGAAFVGGFVISSLIGDGAESDSGTSRSQHTYPSASRGTSARTNGGEYWRDEEHAQSSTNGKGHRVFEAGKQQATEALDLIRGALMGLAATKLQSFLEEALPGLKDERERVEGNASQQTHQRNMPRTAGSSATRQPWTPSESSTATEGTASTQQNEGYPSA